MPLFAPSGGLVYHARAARYARTIWRPFCEEIAAWLNGWQPPTQKLLLVGPSGGYTLPTGWLRKFDSIVAVDFDPLARVFFTLRHRVLAHWIGENIFPTDAKGLDLVPLQRLLDAHLDHAVLFSNVLGQIALAARDEDAVERDLVKLRRLLEGRTWASYHDRLSADRRPSFLYDLDHRNDRDLATLAFGSGEVSSHSTERVGEGMECHTFAWELFPGYWHLIEACRAGAED